MKQSGTEAKSNLGKSGNSRVLLRRAPLPWQPFGDRPALRSGQQRPRVLHSSDDKLVQKFLFQAALLFSNLLFISSLTVSMASLDSFNLSRHTDIFVSLLSVRHLQTSIGSSFCFQFASLNRLSSSLFFSLLQKTQQLLHQPRRLCLHP